MKRVARIAVVVGIMSAAPLPLLGATEALSEAITVTDGDTVRIGQERIRILNIDTPEMGRLAECDAERMLALVAKDRLTEILASGPIQIQRDGTDQYGRTLATMRVAGSDVGELLIDAHVAVRWAGRRHDWCAGG